ncbi:hypothetical protein UFOVP176_29 [uncultured Caudovirales phage]|uniref:Uncharacterized protein n=1 Tax=uncultured Caudovirales phage TaxID=2100421 RepID=A0A6J7WIC6_9CAUD|nr:hypothetical protein UFOVP176_29 [uncultured Caudovirales phage]
MQTLSQTLEAKIQTLRGTGGYAWLHIAQLKQALLDVKDGKDISYKLSTLLED